MIRQQGIPRPLGRPRTIDPQRLCTALDFARIAPTIRGAWPARVVRLVATDLDRSHGRGPEARGRGEALLLVMAGRGATLADCGRSGQGRTGPAPLAAGAGANPDHKRISAGAAQALRGVGSKIEHDPIMKGSL
ncbi:hypothetical protein ACVWWN_003717 [Mycobacterium sp. URHB0021]|jgi:hypothetical protein